MNSIEFTKIIGVLLTVALVVSLSNVIANEIFPKRRDEVRATMEAATEAGPQEAPGAAPGTASGAAPGTAPGAVETVDTEPAQAPTGVAALLAAADPAAGAKAVRRCTGCHTLDKGGKHRLGPNLWDLVGRPVASAAGYKYSNALKDKSGETWTYENLDAFLTRPKGWAPGTKMLFAGIRKPGQRADLIAHLRGLSDNPAALPE